MIIPQLMLMNITVQDFEQGEVLIEEGMPGTSVYVLEEGEVEITIEKTRISKIEKRGAVFGEMSALLGKSRGATVTTTKASKLYVIDDLLTFLRQNPEMSFLLLKGMAERVERMNDQMTQKKKWWKLF